MDRSRDKDQKGKETPYRELSRDNDQKEAYIGNRLQLPNHLLTSVYEKQTNHLFQLSAFYLVHPWLTTLLLPRIISLVPTLWFLENVKTDLVNFFGPNLIPNTWM